ncbi:MAG: acetolactate decarboxylase [Candidatus Omnitrophica bacterium]|nr:acetolactate decarboxylase [Candidatus Omnitrophota bacterium]
MKVFRIAILSIVALFIVGITVWIQQGEDRDALYQVSVLRGLMQGDYDGKIALHTIRSHGDFGLGTFDRLDGEAIELDGVFYQVKADGKVKRVDSNVKSPFAMATFFNSDMEFHLDQDSDYVSLQQLIDSRLPTKNIPYAIKIEGKFSYVKVRSVPEQNKPYPFLSEVIKNQSVFEFKDIEGTLIGFRMPDCMQSVNVPGYHMHFLSRDKTKGGHVLGLSLNNAVIKIDDINRFIMELPKSQDFYNLDFSVSADDGLATEKSK